MDEQLRTVLVVDDSKEYLEDFKALAGGSFNVLCAQSEREAFDILNRKKVDVVFLDLVLGEGSSGIDVLVHMKEAHPNLPVVMMTAHAAIETAVEAMRIGAFHYVSKSPKIEELKTFVDKALEQRSLIRNYEVLREQAERVSGRIVGTSLAMREVLESIQRVAMTEISVLITGESGTGKELVAREIHFASKRHKEAFVAVNCGSLVKDLIESELFGHVKGSFTGATQSKLGKFELADGGTIFLDEVAELDNHSQVKLLRVLQEREIDRVGGTTPIPVNVRVIAATNRDLITTTQQGGFREDLYYRLNVFPISVPPLRQHKDDIPLLVDIFLERYGLTLGKSNLRVSLSAMEQLIRYDWPGNVRELENVIQRGILLSPDGLIQPEHLPREFAENKPGLTQLMSLQKLEREARERAARTAIYQALEQTGWNMRASAEILRIPRKTLYDKCARLGIKLAEKKKLLPPP